MIMYATIIIENGTGGSLGARGEESSVPSAQNQAYLVFDHKVSHSKFIRCVNRIKCNFHWAIDGNSQKIHPSRKMERGGGVQIICIKS